MINQDIKVYRDAGGRVFIDKDDHRRYCDTLCTLARVWGGTAESVLRQALQAGVPGANGAQATMAYFGNDLPIVQKVLEPLRWMIAKTLPGFDIWMTVTGFGDQKEFILALLNWQRIVSLAPKPVGKARREILSRIAGNKYAENVDWMKRYVTPDPNEPEIYKPASKPNVPEHRIIQ